VSFVPATSNISGTLLIRITHGVKVAALGHGRLEHGAATITMRRLGHARHGRWRVTLVLGPGGARTYTLPVRVGHA
jgi:hypothetical protein